MVPSVQQERRGSVSCLSLLLRTLSAFFEYRGDFQRDAECQISRDAFQKGASKIYRMIRLVDNNIHRLVKI